MSTSNPFSLGGRSIQVVVGSSTPVTFSVHEKVICASSDLFKKAVLGGWRESDEGLVRLESDSPDVFNVYMQWLYYRTIPVPIDGPGIRGNAEYILLAKAFVLGDMLQDGGFQDAVMDAMVDKTSSEASDGQKLFLVDVYTFHGHGNWLTDWATQDDLPKEFLFDVAQSLLNKRQRPEWHGLVQGSCEYHQHGASDCYKSLLALRPKPG
ncbi:hypothetical protein B0J15DRAFT_517683 [Fusarium solani]|uniref:BTB domain-containing protein n=1 Tax=Fusarium solani TaxID=169388 RepID=A0A9P9JTA3_FUSSL|nr:uncharacterized protein B0J15DRAFT_517683 [Fusarium solani]KAH7232511.1 hypothetical protein B0J15DRAFT_517683 [Fusarium solani]